MKKNGFTLVELLAVLVLIGIVGAIAGVSVTTIKSKMDKSMFEKTLQLMVISAKQYGEENDDKTSATLQDLVTEDFYDDNGKKVTNYKTGEELVYENVTFKIEKKNNRIYACILQISANSSINQDLKNEFSSSDVFCK